ncbi:MAG: hypothetical protein QGG58_10170 [Chloroflexota bacterium]|jgi:hypothetical protein|nr:hypothetical protein [Chloroflexota bacterium]|tara:strand:- start:2347 stop:2622 length:276 start_codon:yes stop_codon:yes gene_type:complete
MAAARQRHEYEQDQVARTRDVESYSAANQERANRLAMQQRANRLANERERYEYEQDQFAKLRGIEQATGPIRRPHEQQTKALYDFYTPRRW